MFRGGRGAESQNVNLRALEKIINYTQTWYSPGRGRQFAVAMNVPAHYCNGSSELDIGFLNRDNPYEIRTELRDNHIYEGVDLIAATQREDNTGNFYHSEYLLLNHPHPEQSRMKELLNVDADGCVIFYTYNSPCKHTCLNEDAERNIHNAVRMLGEHQGPKAFVYNQIFQNDDQDLEEHLARINAFVPVYRCQPTRTSNFNLYQYPNPYMNYYLNAYLHPDRAMNLNPYYNHHP
ncbi:uncharacterized protein LOC118827116 [Colossoma macropomum]|uniref:uncharacterized protein LOC118827116 n=1 Tax=Colossoma macropomum TaxID=42526 RepID=UPI001863D4FD|nr:uncharacterized protein LOC118827116 [Colossoma macropomum]XP_036454239.1 uncharacterized protein LOC118827116 [Colossoma macropomum]